MSRMSELNIEIYELLVNNYTPNYISQRLHIPLSFIEPVEAEVNYKENVYYGDDYSENNLLDNCY